MKVHVLAKYGVIVPSFLSTSNLSAWKNELVLDKAIGGAILESFGTTSTFSTGSGKHVVCLLFDLLKKEYPMDESLRALF